MKEQLNNNFNLPSTIRKNLKFPVINTGLYKLLQDEGN